MQASKSIIVDGKPGLIGCTKGILNVDGGTYVLIQEPATATEPGYIQGYYIAQQTSIPRKKYIGIIWGKVKISAPDLRPMPEYYDPVTGKCLFVEDRSEDGLESISDEHSFQEVAPTIFWLSYDAFFEMEGADKAGKVLFGIALDRFCERELKIGKVLKMNLTDYELIQPVNFSLAFTNRQTEEDPFILTVTPIHFEGELADIRYSPDGITWQENNILTYLTRENNTVYVRDIAGTTAKKNINPTDWIDNILP